MPLNLVLRLPRYQPKKNGKLICELCRGFTSVARFDMQLIHLKKHCPFGTDLPHLVYNKIELKLNIFCQIVHFITFPLIYSLWWLSFKYLHAVVQNEHWNVIKISFEFLHYRIKLQIRVWNTNFSKMDWTWLCFYQLIKIIYNNQGKANVYFIF